MTLLQTLITSIFLIISLPAIGQTETLPLVTKADLTDAYQGSFKISYWDDVSGTAYSSGRVAYNSSRNSVIVDSHVYQLALAEFQLPDILSKSGDKSILPNATPLQGYTKVLERTFTGNTQNLDRLGGLAFINGELVIQSYETYDANGTITHTTAIVEDPSDLKNSKIRGFLEMDGGARTVNYLSPIPKEWQPQLRGDWLAGNGNGMSIDSRLSVGPSLFSFSKSDLVSSNKDVKTHAWLNYPVKNALSTSLWRDYSTPGYEGWDLYNSTGNNDMWTSISSAWFGFIVPGTRTFVVLGRSGMTDGGGYKITNKAGYTCPGGCSFDPEDVHTFYWLFDLNDIISASSTYAPLPYDYGIFDDKFISYGSQGAVGTIFGGSFDAETGTLILNHGPATSETGSKEGSQILSVYKLSTATKLSPPFAPTNIKGSTN